ncbi:hypothetical protein TPENAI_60280 [Tenacibaculum litopenaei]|uniref:hypothetical protein n=1 Tax=Tenacibaculum litopenaei TaxID=396016 RepID=UPI003894B6B8
MFENQVVSYRGAAVIDDVSGRKEGTVTKYAVLEAYIGAKDSSNAGEAIADPIAYIGALNSANAIEPNSNTAGVIIQSSVSRNGKKINSYYN